MPGSTISNAPENDICSFFYAIEIKEGTKGRLHEGWEKARMDLIIEYLTKLCALLRMVMPIIPRKVKNTIEMQKKIVHSMEKVL